MPRLSDRMLDSISLQALKSTCTFGLVVLTLAGVYSISPRVVRPRHAYTGDQADEWHITESDTVLAHSRIVLSDCEANPHVLRLDLPYAGATAESVTLEGEPIDFDQVLTGSTQPTGVYLALNRPASALRGELLEVVWSLPLQALQVSPDNYRTELKGLLPIRKYSLNIVVDRGADFEIARHPGLRIFTPFFATRRKPSAASFGTCGLGIRRRRTSSDS